MAIVLFHIGKGGAGKSTVSSLTAVAAAERGYDTVLASLDPAHNLADIFSMDLGDRDTRVSTHLMLREIDAKHWSKRYLRDIEEQMRRNYTYLTALNLDRHFRVLRHAPGMEEFALTLAFRHLLREHEEADLIVCDMPPTALALRFLAAPSIALSWTRELTLLRRAMLEKNRIATKIRFGSAEFERDRVLQRLEADTLQHTREQQLFRDTSRCRVRIVCNGDLLSQREGARIEEELRGLGIHADGFTLNRCAPDAMAIPELSALPSRTVPESDAPLFGLDALRGFAGDLELQLPLP